MNSRFLKNRLHTIPLKMLIVSLLISGFLAIFLSSQVGARLIPIDWLHDELSYEAGSSNDTHDSCVWQDRQIAAYGNNRYEHNFTEFPSETVHLCVYSVGQIQYGQYSRDAFDGSYYYIASTERAIAVSLNGGPMMPVSNIPWNVRLLGSDGGPFMYAEPLRYANGFNLRLYDNLIEHIKPSLIGSHLNYEIDGGYYTYGRTDGQEAGLDGVSVSRNGQWLSFVVNNFGVMRLNTETKDVRRVASYRYSNSAWPMQGAETSITDDGRYILRAGTNVSFDLIVISSTCGLAAPQHDFYDVSGMGNRACPSRTLNAMTDVHSTARSSGLYEYSRMSIDESIVPARIIYYDGYDWGRLSVSKDRLYYLALGDSYASGEGDITIDGVDHYLLGTNIYGDYHQGIPRETCHISSRSYAMRIAESMQLQRGVDMQSVACSGAITTDVLTSSLKSNGYVDADYLGQSTQRISQSGPRLSGLSNMIQLKDEARQSYTPGRVQQIELVRKARPKYATVMMGGNDIDFPGVMMACASNAMPSADETCDYAQGGGLVGEAKKIYDLYPKLVDFYKALMDASPQTTIYAIGYPQFMDENSQSCAEMLNLYSKPERKAIHNLIAYANSVIHNAALDAGVKYIDISDALTGKKLCSDGTGMTGISDALATMVYTDYMKSLTMSDSTLAKYINILPVGTLHDAALQMYIAEQSASKLAGFLYSPATALANFTQELSHPNAVGHAAIYDTIKSGLGDDLLDSAVCNERVSCPGGVALGQPNVSAYIPGLVVKEGTVYQSGNGKVSVGRKASSGKNGIGSLAKKTAGQFIRIAINMIDGAIDPLKPVIVEIHSQPVALGDMTRVGDNYELITSLSQEIAVGEHILHIKGTLLDGQSFDIDSPIFVEGPEGDIDDDGIMDSVDTCAFGKPSGVDSDHDGIDDACDMYIEHGVIGAPDSASIGLSTNNTNVLGSDDVEGGAKNPNLALLGDNKSHLSLDAHDGNHLLLLFALILSCLVFVITWLRYIRVRR